MKPNTYYENDLIQVDPNERENALMEVAGTGNAFLPRFQLFGGSSDACKEGKIGIGRYGLVRGKEIQDLGPVVDILVCSGRVKALDFSGENIIVSYDHNTDIFKEIAEGSFVKDSKKMFGPEYLIWVPVAVTFALLFLSSPTARNEAPSLHSRLRKAATCKAHLINGKKHKWHGPLFTPCSTPFDLPAKEALDKEVEKFQNPKDGDAVEVEGEESADRER